MGAAFRFRSANPSLLKFREEDSGSLVAELDLSKDPLTVGPFYKKGDWPRCDRAFVEVIRLSRFQVRQATVDVIADVRDATGGPFVHSVQLSLQVLVPARSVEKSGTEQTLEAGGVGKVPDVEQTGGTDMLRSELDVIDFLSDRYPTYAGSRNLWKRAGGREGDVPELESPLDRWQQLWERAGSGARVTRVRLVGAVLSQYPGSVPLLHYLAERCGPNLRDAAMKVVERLQEIDETAGVEAVAEALTELGVGGDDALAALAGPMEGRLTADKRSWLSATLESVRDGALEVWKGTVKSAAEGAVRALAGTNPAP